MYINSFVLKDIFEVQSAWWNYPRVRTARSTVKGISLQCSRGACQSR